MKYLKTVIEKYKLLLMIVEVIAISIGLYYVDKYALAVGKLVNLYHNDIGTFKIVLAVLIIVFLVICFYVLKSIFKKDINYCDKLIVMALPVIVIYLLLNVGLEHTYKLIGYILIIINVLVIIYRSIKLKNIDKKKKTKKRK